MGNQKSKLIVLKDFFGYRPAISGGDANLSPDVFAELPYERQIAVGGMKGFNAELKALSEDEKIELAQLAARAMGLTQEQVGFPLQ